MISKDSIEQLKQILNIYEVISSYIELKKSGVNYVACCPFHEEKTPSFHVNIQKGFYKCFGCDASGDSITFVMEKEHLSFYEAIEKLANAFNFQLTYTKESQQSDKSIFEYLAKIAQFFYSNLKKNPHILEYLHNRGLDLKSIERFQIGWSGESSAFVRFLNEQKCSFDKLLEIGIISKSTSGIYAKFSNRIMFPISAPNGQIVGFGGRILDGKIAKYINSNQSKIFNKSQLLYGYHLAKDSVFKEKKIIVTEGYLDVVMMAQAGFQNVVATLGTALGKEHLPLLSKGEPSILLCYDGDSAGIKAAFRAAQILAHKSGGVVIFDNGKDPADMVKEGKIKDLMEKLAKPISFIEFVLNTIAINYDLNNPLQKERALNEALAFFNNLSEFLQNEYRALFARTLRVSPYLIGIKKTALKHIAKEDSFKKVEDVIIKSMLEDDSLLDFALDYIDERAFCYDGHLFLHLKNGDCRHKDLLGILLNPQIKALSMSDFKNQLLMFIANFYTKKLQESKASAESIEVKLENIKINQIKLKELKNGKLVRIS